LKTTVISLTDDTIRFIVSGIDNAFANTLRRTMVAEVPIMTIEDIFYFDNSSLVADEVLAHRLGLTPLTTDLDKYVLPEDCDCNAELGCPNCRAVLTMDIEADEDIITVYSGDLVPDDPDTAPVSAKIILAKLAPKQAIKFEAYAQLGQGKTHIKWSPVSMCVYQNVSMIPVEDKVMAEECIMDCGDAAEMVGDMVKVIDIQKFESCKRCRELVTRDTIMDNLVPDEFLFTVESNGALTPKRIVTEAVKILKKRLGELTSKIDADDLHTPISDFDFTRPVERKLYNEEPEASEEPETSEAPEASADSEDTDEEVETTGDN